MVDRPADHTQVGARRQWPRLQVQGRLRTRITTLQVDVDMRDISRGGFLVAAPEDITTGDIHVFEVTMPSGQPVTLRARAVYCHAPRANEPAYLSGWRCAPDDSTQRSLDLILDALVGDQPLDDPDLASQPAPKTTSAWELAITSLASGQVAGHALVCAELRYASTRWIVAAQIDRRYGSPAIWRAVVGELERAGDSGLLPIESVTGSLLLPEALRASCALRVDRRPTFPTGRRDALTDALDRHLWDLSASEPALR